MKIELDLPDGMVKDLREKSVHRGISLEVYATDLLYQALAQQELGEELLHQALAQQELGEEGKIENRPDWQAAIERSRADLAAGRTIQHEEVEAWQRGHRGSSGRRKP